MKASPTTGGHPMTFIAKQCSQVRLRSAVLLVLTLALASERPAHAETTKLGGKFCVEGSVSLTDAGKLSVEFMKSMKGRITGLGATLRRALGRAKSEAHRRELKKAIERL